MKKFKKGFILEPVAADDFTYDFTSEFVALSKVVSSGEYEISAELYDVSGEQIAVTAPVLFSFHVPVEAPIEVVDEEEIAASLDLAVNLDASVGVDSVGSGFANRALGYLPYLQDFADLTLLVDGSRLDDVALVFDLSGEALEDYLLQFSFIFEDGSVRSFFSAPLDGSLSFTLPGHTFYDCVDLADGSTVVELQAAFIRQSDKSAVSVLTYDFSFRPLISLLEPVPPTEEVPEEEVAGGVSRVRILSPVDTALFMGSDLHKGLLPLTDTILEVAARDVPVKATVLWYVVRGKKALRFADVEKVYHGKRKPVGVGTSLDWDCNYRKLFKKVRRIPATFTLICVVVSGRKKDHGDIVGWNYLVLTDPLPKLPSLKLKFYNYRPKKGMITLPEGSGYFDLAAGRFERSGPPFVVEYGSALFDREVSYQFLLVKTPSLSSQSLVGRFGSSERLVLSTVSSSGSLQPFTLQGPGVDALYSLLQENHRVITFAFSPVTTKGESLSGWRVPASVRPTFTVDFSNVIREEGPPAEVVEEALVDERLVGTGEDFLVLGLDEHRMVYLDEDDSEDILSLLGGTD